LSKTRRKFADAIKFKIIIEAIKGQKQLVRLHQNMEYIRTRLPTGKEQFMDKGASVFSTKKDSQLDEKEKQEEYLYKKIGKQQVQLDFLKKT